MNGVYRTIVDVTDFGPYVSKIIFKVPRPVKSEMVTKDTFSVYVDRRDIVTGDTVEVRQGWMSEVKYPSRGYCEIEGAYVSTMDGEAVEEGPYITLALPTRPFYQLSSTIAVSEHHNQFVFNDFKVTQVMPIGDEEVGSLTGLVYNRFMNETIPHKSGWVNGTSIDKKMPLKYGYYAPTIGKGKRPLIIWLHGGGEGGDDPTVAYIGNNVVNLSKDKVQSYFDGAYVLAPQSPTMWMDDGIDMIGDKGETIYLEALKNLIDEFVELHEDIDRDRIYLGGCSNGGFMTMKLIIAYPDYFAAAYPVCEALYDRVITDEQIDSIKHIPIWFTHAKNDTIVAPDLTVVPTYKRLIEAGNEQAYFSYFDEVIDSKGYKYDNFGHASWILMLNDESRLDFDGQPVIHEGEAVTLLRWLSKQSRQ